MQDRNTVGDTAGANTRDAYKPCYISDVDTIDKHFHGLFVIM